MIKRVLVHVAYAIAVVAVLGIVWHFVADFRDTVNRKQMEALKTCHVVAPYTTKRAYEQELNATYKDTEPNLDTQVEFEDCPFGQMRVARWHRISVGQTPDGRE